MKDLASRNRLLTKPPVKAIVVMTLAFLLLARQPGVFAYTASYYTLESCLREGTSGIRADGRKLDDEELICASWDYSFGTRLLVTNVANGKSVVVVVRDRGPNKKLYKKGRVIDLSKRAFSQIADLKQGIIQISIKEIK